MTEEAEQTPTAAPPVPPEEREENTYVIRPNFQYKFRPVRVKEMIHMTLNEVLADKMYEPEHVTDWTRQIADKIKEQLKGMEYDRYKFIVQVMIAEQRGQGTKMACRCFWDVDTDNKAEDMFMNDYLVCVAAAFGVFHY